jgi:hypothetical protein
MAGVDEATKIVHGSQPSTHRGDDPLVHHNPSGGTGHQDGPARTNPTGATAEFSHGVVDTNPKGDRAAMAGIVTDNPRGGTAPMSHGVNSNPTSG